MSFLGVEVHRVLHLFLLLMQGMHQFWVSGGQQGDTWRRCGEGERWFEHNCTVQPGLGWHIWEPCNYASNLAYDRLVLLLPVLLL